MSFQGKNCVDEIRSPRKTNRTQADRATCLARSIYLTIYVSELSFVNEIGRIYCY